MLPWALRQPAEDPPPLLPAPPAIAGQAGGWWAIAPLAAYLAERELLLPARLLGSGHQPLAFVLAHGCYLCAPIADLLGLTPAQGWPAWIERITALALGPDPGHTHHLAQGAADDCA